MILIFSSDIFTNLDKENAEDKLSYLIEALKNVAVDKNAGWKRQKVMFEGYPRMSQDLLKNIQTIHSKLSKLIEANPYIMYYVKLAGWFIKTTTHALCGGAALLLFWSSLSFY